MVVDKIACRSEIADLRRKCDRYAESEEKWKRKTQMLQKMCNDLNTVMRRYITDVVAKKEKVAPLKITRSVGLQVMTDRNRAARAGQAQQQVNAKSTGAAIRNQNTANNHQQQQVSRPPVQPQQGATIQLAQNVRAIPISNTNSANIMRTAQQSPAVNSRVRIHKCTFFKDLLTFYFSSRLCRLASRLSALHRTRIKLSL